jgi:hypothetical protein
MNRMVKDKEERKWLTTFAILFHVPHRSGRWTAEEGHRDPSNCALGYICMNLECIFKNLLEIVESLRFQWAQAPIVNYPGL